MSELCATTYPIDRMDADADGWDLVNHASLSRTTRITSLLFFVSNDLDLSPAVSAVLSFVPGAVGGK